MTGLAFHPLGIFIFGIAGGFLMPLLYQRGKTWLNSGFVIMFSGMTLSAVIPAVAVLSSGQAIEITTAGALPPISINLRFGLWEAAASSTATLVAGLLVIAFWQNIRGKYVPLLLLLIATMGVNGMIQTRDLFNLFVFLEIVSVGTYGLLSLSTSKAGVQAAFKYVMATMVASALVLLGAVLLYEYTGSLNIDQLIEAAPPLGPTVVGLALILVLAGFLIELKPYPSGGWGLDVYETAPAPLAAFISVVASTGLIFALSKLLPLYDAALEMLVITAAITFLASNLAGLRQVSVFRLFGYSSIGQMALLLLAMAVLTQIGAERQMPYILLGLFVNHLLAKAGLFCLAGTLRSKTVDQPLGLVKRPPQVMLLGIFVIAIAGLPPFPGFWAKWELVMLLAASDKIALIGVILVGSLCEAAYLFRWFFNALGERNATDAEEDVENSVPRWNESLPPVVMAVSLLATGVLGASVSESLALSVFIPLLAGLIIFCLEPLPARIKGGVTLVVVALSNVLVTPSEGISGLFAPLLLLGGLVVASAGLVWPGQRIGHYPLLTVLLVSVYSLFSVDTGLAFYTLWEFVTLSSAFLIARNATARPEALRFLVFSLAAAFCLMAGFAVIASDAGSRTLLAAFDLSPGSEFGIALLALGFLIKTAAVGVHVWQPGAYAAASDDVTALLSAVVSKTAIFGLLITAYFTLRSQLSEDLGYTLAWIGMGTTVFGAAMALSQDELKRLLAYSSLSQLGYIVTAIGLMGHLGWVTAFYLVASHMFVKGILFLAVAAVRMRTGRTKLSEGGGLLRAMPITALIVGIALLSMSGLPPLMGFGAKWLLLSAMAEKGWGALEIMTLIATFLGFWYMVRLFTALFLGSPSGAAQQSEAPTLILLPQVILVGGIFVLSLFPKLVMDPVSAAIDPAFAATLVWEGQSLETIYGVWDPTSTMLTAVVGAIALAMIWWVISRLGPSRGALRTALLSAVPLPSRLMPPVATWFWTFVATSAFRTGDVFRSVYSGNAQTYVLQALLYFLVLVAAVFLTTQ